ncbi:MAG: hypothetical protein ACK4KW_04610 [Gemmobacter sp.]
MTDTGIERLRLVARLLRDRDLAELAAASAATRLTRHRITELDARITLPEDLSLTAGARAMLLHRAWREARRAELNRLLAGRIAVELEARERARRSFGRASLLDRPLSRS